MSDSDNDSDVTENNKSMNMESRQAKKYVLPVRSLTARVLKSLHSDRNHENSSPLSAADRRILDYSSVERRKSSVDQLAERIAAAQKEKDEMSTKQHIFTTLHDPTFSKTGKIFILVQFAIIIILMCIRINIYIYMKDLILSF